MDSCPKCVQRRWFILIVQYLDEMFSKYNLRPFVHRIALALIIMSYTQ